MPGAGFEPATFGLQNRCTTTVLTRRRGGFTTCQLTSQTFSSPDKTAEIGGLSLKQPFDVSQIAS